MYFKKGNEKYHGGQLTLSSCSNYDNKNTDKTNDEILKFIRVIKREPIFNVI